MKLDAKLIGYITTFENATGARVKDCFFGKDKELIFVVQKGYLGKAIGKSGANVRSISAKLKHRLKVIGFDDDPAKFVSNLLFPLNGFEIIKEDEKIIIKTEDKVLKGKVYGRDRGNLAWVNEVFHKYFKDLNVIVG